MNIRTYFISIAERRQYKPFSILSPPKDRGQLRTRSVDYHVERSDSQSENELMEAGSITRLQLNL